MCTSSAIYANVLLLSVLLGSHSIGQEVVYLVSSYVLHLPCLLGDPGFGSPHDLILLIGLPSGITPDHWCAHEFHLQLHNGQIATSTSPLLFVLSR